MAALHPRSSRSRQTTRQLWAERLVRFSRTGLSVVAFCAAEAVSVNAFFYWKRQLTAGASVPPPQPELRFLPVRVQTLSTPVEVVLPNGSVLRLTPGCDLAFVRSLLDTLGGQPD